MLAKDSAGLELLAEQSSTRAELRDRITVLEKRNEELQVQLLAISSASAAATAKVAMLEGRVAILEGVIEEVEGERDRAHEAADEAYLYLRQVLVALVKAQAFLEGCSEDACPGGLPRKQARDALAGLLANVTSYIDARGGHHGGLKGSACK